MEFGFGSQANFTRVFRKAANRSPGQYRELCCGQIEAIADEPDPNDRRDCS
ncbi:MULTISPECIES: AraC family transcriptional regulator [unclassified Bradyrhizobium]|uniref:AraC family transcriptional regulator n=1 Tax=unclassified Bradyrhizobium TaxID=2631580 RepID=UPI0024E155F4|nr:MULTISPECIES: AraC family transcriptional regulator [unclassified Bradyrhizobium]